MAANPNPTRISAAMWEFVEALEALEAADTEYAGSWGDFKPGYHADRNTLLKNPNWRNDYSIRLPADKLGPSAMGAAVDWTFRSAQRGDFANIRKYGDRVRRAFLARDPRLHGWREVLCQGDSDAAADGYDFVSWTERTPDSTHTWHFHFSTLRQFIEDRTHYQAMLSILRGETLAQWQRKDDEMPKAFLYDGGYWLAQGGKREIIKDGDDMAKANALYPGACYPGPDKAGFPTPDLKVSGWTIDEVDRLLGREYAPHDGGSGGLAPHVHSLDAPGANTGPAITD